MTADQLCQLVKKQFGLQYLKVYAAEGRMSEYVSEIAILPGSGRDEEYLDAALEKGAEVYITGDITHHAGLDAVGRSLILIDAGHYGMESIFIEYIDQYLNKVLSANIQILTMPVRDPGMIY